MPVPNFGSLTGLEVVWKFVVGAGVEHETTVSNLNPSYLELSWVRAGFCLFLQEFKFPAEEIGF